MLVGNRRILAVTLLLLCSASLVCGCGGKKGAEGRTTAAAAGEATTGGEAGPGAEEGAEGAASSEVEGQPGDPKTQAGKTPKKDVSPWGAPEGESGRPLPRRRALRKDERKDFRKALAMAERGDYKGARKILEGIVKPSPRAFQIWYSLGVLADREGKETQALNYYKRALRKQPDYEAAVQGIVNIHLRGGALNKAIRFVEPIARKWERNLHLQGIYADLLVQARRLEEAETTARKALRRDERFVPAMISLIKASLGRGRKELAESILQQALVIDKKNPELHFLQGKMYEREDRLADALKSYRKAVELRPSYAEARVALGIQYLASGNYDQALMQFETTARLAPKLVAVHLNLGDAYRATKQWQKAKASFDKALKMKRDLPEAHFNLGLMYMAAGDDFPGMKKLDALNRALSEFGEYRRSMGGRLSRDDPSEAHISDIQRSIEREQKRIEREKARAQRDKERAARAAAAKAEAEAAAKGKAKSSGGKGK